MPPEHEHALKYAMEATKVYLMERYKRNYPQYFADAEITVRPATHQDYFIPPSIAQKCVVVERTRLGETGCKTFACFPFKKNWDPCQEADEPRWMHLGDGFSLACQKSCADHKMDADWTSDGRCVVSNPLKKSVAALPEKIFERESRHAFHGGLNLVDGHLELNPLYCEAYGLEFQDKDCVVPAGQDFGEFFFGKTLVRAAKAAKLPAFQRPLPPLPAYVHFVPVVKRNKRSLPLIEVEEQPLVKEIAIDLTKDIGLEVTEYAVKRFIKKKCPQLLAKTIESVSAKLVLSNAMKLGLKQLATSSLKTLGSSVTVVGTIYAIYDMVLSILDMFDPWDYMKVLDKKKLGTLDLRLDYQYFGGGRIRPELTPEFVWEYNLLTDNDGQIEFMIERAEEYLQALQQIPPNKYNYKPPRRMENWEMQEKVNGIVFKCALLVVMVLSLVMLEWVHFTTCALFFVMLFYRTY